MKNVIASLEKLKNQSIPAGFEDKLQAKIVINGEKQFLNDIELVSITTERKVVTSDVESFKKKVIDSLTEFLRQRLQFRNKELLLALEALSKFDDSDAIKKVHEYVGYDLDLASLYLQFGDLCEEKQVTELSIDKIVKHLASPEQIVHFREIAMVLARTVASTPHSADVERCISANNLLKTNIRSNLALATENKYLYLYSF